MKAIYEFRDYKVYLNALAAEKGQRSGFKSALAKACGCNNAYVSSVLNASAHFSLEQTELICSELKLSAAESHYLLLLVQRARAGTSRLVRYFDRQIEEVLEQNLNVKKRLAVKATLGREEQTQYYSSWIYAAIHVATSVPRLNGSAEKIAEYLDLPLANVREVLSFLETSGLVARGKGGYKPTDKHIHLGLDSVNLNRHHANWRLRALRDLDGNGSEQNLHYSSAVSLSREDSFRVREILLSALKSASEVIMASPEEDIFALNIDFMPLEKIR